MLRSIVRMGWFGRMFGGNAVVNAALALESVDLPSKIVTPWGDGQLAQWVYEDLLGKKGPVTRTQALGVPAVAAGRALIVGELQARPLRAVQGGAPLESNRQPPWASRSDSSMGPVQRMAHTLDDHIFYGDALWAVKRGERSGDERGPILDAAYVPRSLWRVEHGEVQVLVAGKWVDADPDQVLYIPAAHEGLLAVASDSIRGALDLERAWKQQARTPVPAILLRAREQHGFSQEQVTEYVKQVAAARRGEDGAVMYVPFEFEAEVVGQTATDLLTEGRNAARLDIAAYLNLNPTMLGAALPKASLNYETAEGSRSEFTDRLSYWTAPIEEALSHDRVVPRGTAMRFDFNPTPVPELASTGPAVED